MFKIANRLVKLNFMFKEILGNFFERKVLWKSEVKLRH
jgi:hypothetical protein